MIADRDAAASRDAELNWEWSVIATAIVDPSSLEAAEELLPSDFTGVNQIVWAEILNLRTRNAVDLRSLGNALENCPDWERVSPEESPADFLAQALVFRGSNMEAYVSAVLDRSTRRTLKRYAALIAQEAEDTGRPIEEVLDHAENKILSLRRNHGANDLSMADIMAIFAPRFEGMIEGTIRPCWEPEVQGIRDIVDYLEETDFMVNAARPGEGKSSWMRYEFFMAAKKYNRSVGILNYENDPLEYARYFLAIETGIDSLKIRKPTRLSPEEKVRIREAVQLLARLPIRVVTTDRNVNAAIAKARKMVSQDHITLLGLDYIQLLNNGIENRVNDLTLTTGRLRQFALDFHVPVIANAQLSRDIERRGQDSEPRLDDLRESGSIEQDATIVMFPRPVRNPSIAQMEQFPENFDERGQLMNSRPRAIPVNFHILKNRNGTIGVTDPVKWCKHLDTYQTLMRGSIPR